MYGRPSKYKFESSHTGSADNHDWLDNTVLEYKTTPEWWALQALVHHRSRTWIKAISHCRTHEQIAQDMLFSALH